MSAATDEPDGFDPTTWRADKPIEHPDAEVIEWRPPRQDTPPVDPPDEPATLYATAMRSQHASRRPIVPPWMRNRHDAKHVIGAATKGAAYNAGYHAVYSWKYAGRVMWRAPVGGVRVVARVGGWIFDAEGMPARGAAIRSEDTKEYRALSKQRNDRVKLRGTVAIVGAVALVVGVIAARVYLPLWAEYAALAVLVLALAWYGSPIGKPITDRVTPVQRFIKLTAEMTRNAIVACPVGVKDGAEIQFVREIYRDPPGQTAEIELPPGVIADDIVKVRAKLAGAMRLPLQQVWPQHVQGESPSRLAIWVADKPVNLMRNPTLPWIKEGRLSYFAPFIIGTDERMRPAKFLAVEKNTLIAGQPGCGKSLDGRVIALGLATDPLVDFIIYDLKGIGDYDPLEPLCLNGMYGSGPDEQTKAEALASLEWLYAECERRAPLIKSYVKRGVGKENKVNRAMAERDPRLRPIVAIYDEIQELITDPELGKRAKFLLVSLSKRSRALGIHLVLESQRLDKPSLPIEITSQIAIRFCGAVPSHVECNLVLGTNASSMGARPHDFQPGPPDEGGDSGWTWRTGYGRLGIVRFAWIDNDTAHAVVKRAIAMREGSARRGDPEKVKSRNVLADVRSVLMPGEDALWSELLIERLVELAPDMYGGLTVEAFGALMAAAGLRTVSIHRKVEGVGKTKYGVKRKELDAAMAAKELGS